MKKIKVLIVVFLFLLVVMLPEVAGIESVREESTDAYGGPRPISDGQTAWQSFKHENSCVVSKIALKCKKSDADTVGTFNITIQTGTYNGPTGTVLGYYQANINTVSTSEAWVTFTLQKEAPISANTYYCIVVSVSGASSGKYFAWTYSQTFNPNGPYADGRPSDWTNRDFTFQVLGYTPGPPTSFTATTINHFRIDLSWSKGINADYTYIEAKLGSYPTNRTDGTTIYNGTGTSYSHTGLSQTQHWYYSVWSWNTTDGMSDGFAQTDATTFANIPPAFETPYPINNSIGQDISLIWSIFISDLDEDIFNWTIDCSNSQNNLSNDDTNGTKSLSLSGLAYNATYTVWVNATDGLDWTREWFTFTTRTEYVPGPPTSFTSIAYNRTRIDLSWSKGTNADYTLVVAKLSSCPTNKTDGTDIYNDTGINYSHTGLSPGQHWYYCAWSWNTTDNMSDGFAQTDTYTTLYPAWDINQDATVNYLDVSALVSHYGQSGAPGWISEDINSDGIVNYLDVSSLVSHYGESY